MRFQEASTLSSSYHMGDNDLNQTSRIFSSCETESSVGREGTSVSEVPSSALLLRSFVTPSDGSAPSQESDCFVTPSDGSAPSQESDCSQAASTQFEDAMSSRREEPVCYTESTAIKESNGSAGPRLDESVIDTQRTVPYEYSASVASKEVSLITTDSSSSMDMGASECDKQPVSPAFSIVTSTGGRAFSPSNVPRPPSESDRVVRKQFSGIIFPTGTEKKTSKKEDESSTTADSTVDNSKSNESDADSIREQVEVRWLPDLAVEHSFRPSTSRKAWQGAQVTSVERIPYVHGSYASAAPLMVYNKKWMGILKRLMPANHADAMEILREAEEARARRSNNDQQMARLMKWAENNPVVAAFGVLNSNSGTDETVSVDPSSPRRSRKYPGKRESKGQRKVVPVLEWDVFLDPTLVKKVGAAMVAAEQMKNDSNSDYQDQIAADIEVDRQVGRLINRMMLAHGSASHLVSEALGFASQYNFTKLVEQGESQRYYRRKESEKKWKRSGLHFSRNGMDLGGKVWVVREQAHGAFMNFDSHRRSVIAGKASAKPAGIFVERWLALFLRALHIAKATEGELSLGRFFIEDDESMPQVEPEADKTGPPMCGVFLCLGIEDPNSARVDHARTSMAITAGQIEEVLGSPLRVILDLKSRRVPARVWARVIDNMCSRGIVVEGLGSFDIEELRYVGALCASNVTGVRFFHSAGDLQKACHAKEVQVGDTVFFNAGSLLWEKPSKISNVVCGNPDISEAVVEDIQDKEDGVRFQPFAFPRNNNKDDLRSLDCQSTLQDYKDKFKLNIGCYVQEFSISHQNLDAVTRFLNKNKSLYNLGLAWGGINGQCHEGLSGDGYWNQRYMGRKWDATAKPTDDMQLLAPEDHPLVQKAVMAGAWGAIGTVNNVGDEHAPETEAIKFGACALQNAGHPTCG